jgi:hypothetical protein
MDSRLLNYAKSPIPVLNSILPHSYVIMPALLANLDSLTSSSSSSPSSSNSPSSSPSTYVSNHSKQNIISNTRNNNNKLQNFTKSSKEIVYTTKQIQLKNRNINSNDTNQTPNFYSHPIVQQTVINNFVNEASLDHIDASVQTNAINTLTTSLDTSSIINSTTKFITDSFINDNPVLEVNNNDNNNNNQESIKNVGYNNNSSNIELINNNNEDNSDSLAYTISCPADWQFNIKQMLNCGVLLAKLIHKEPIEICRNYNIKLACCVCKLRFDTLENLLEHKVKSFDCKNNIKIINNDIKNDHDSLELIENEDGFDNEEYDFDDEIDGDISNNESDEYNDIDEDDDEDEEEELAFEYVNEESNDENDVINSKKNRNLKSRPSKKNSNAIGFVTKDNENSNKPRRKYTKLKQTSEVTYNCESILFYYFTFVLIFNRRLHFFSIIRV